MTDTIEWGEPLTVSEVKALGLPGETPVKGTWEVRLLNEWRLDNIWQFYQLPADHPAYIIHRYNKEHGTNFVYWAGGDEAPDDWDLSKPMIFRDGTTETVGERCTYAHLYRWDVVNSRDIIGYTKKPQLVTEEASEPLQSAKWQSAPANHGPAADDKGEAGDWKPCERTVRMCIEALPGPVPDTDQLNQGYNACHQNTVAALEALLPKPDRAEELVKVFRDEVSFLEWKWSIDEILKQFGDWLIERGEIKG